jgi:hypothetical protein
VIGEAGEGDLDRAAGGVSPRAAAAAYAYEPRLVRVALGRTTHAAESGVELFGRSGSPAVHCTVNPLVDKSEGWMSTNLETRPRADSWLTETDLVV